MSASPADALRAFCETSLDDHFAAHAAVDPAERALALSRQAAAGVPAYRRVLAEHGIDPGAIQTPEDFARLPLLTKDGYLRVHPLPDLCLGGALRGCDTVAVSSGSTGLPTYFPRGAHHELEVAWRFEQVFRDSFRAHQRTTLAVVCFPLGTWVGGMFTAACCRHLAAKGYPLLVVTPGNQPPEILRAVRELGPLYEQVVLLGYPPFLKDVVDAGRAGGLDWSPYRTKLVLAGEIFSEAWRDILTERAGMGDARTSSASLYGTADAGVLGNETPLSIAIRRFAAAHTDACQALFDQRRPPTLVQYDPVDRYFEQVGESLVFTGIGGGIPLVRYAIGDSGGVVPYAAMIDQVRALGFQPPEPGRPLPFVFLFGRRHHAVSFYGANVFAEMVRMGLEHPELAEQVSGKFVMEVVEDDAGDRHLWIDVELARGVSPNPELEAAAASALRNALLGASGEYGAYVPAARQLPRVRLWTHAHPEHFPVGVKHRYVRA